MTFVWYIPKKHLSLQRRIRRCKSQLSGYKNNDLSIQIKIVNSHNNGGDVSAEKKIKMVL